MDDTQRIIVGSLGVGLILAGIGFLVAGAFAAGVPLVVVGVVVATLGFLSWRQRQPATEPTVQDHGPRVALDGEGPMVIAREIVNNGIIAHTVTPPSTPRVSTIEQRSELRRRIGDLLTQGDKINMAATRELLVRDAVPWQKNVATLLSDALVDQDPTTYFAQMGQGDWAQIVVEMRNQLKYLREILGNLDQFKIKEEWQP